MEISHSWRFASSSGKGVYETLQYADGSVSCNCFGWTRRVGPNGSRTCKHCRSVQAGTADAECMQGTSLDLARGINVSNRTSLKPVGKVTAKSFDTTKIKTREKVPARKILWK